MRAGRRDPLQVVSLYTPYRTVLLVFGSVSFSIFFLSTVECEFYYEVLIRAVLTERVLLSDEGAYWKDILVIEQ